MTPQSLEEVYAKLSKRHLGGKNGVSEKLVPGVGPIPCSVMFIAEAPGAEEDKAGIPLVGKSGKIFNELLELSGLKREEVFTTNIFKYRPPKNRDPLNEEVAESTECLSEEIKLVNPVLIVPMGRVALSVFYPGSSVSETRSKFRDAETPGRKIFCTYHPAIALYDSRNGKQRLKNDFLKIGRFLAEM